MATIHVLAEKDDVSYSHTLKKLLKVNVEKTPDQQQRHLGRSFGNTGISRSSAPSARHDPTETLASRQSPNESPSGSPGPRGRAREPSVGLHTAPIIPGILPGNTSGKATRRATYHPPPEPPASFMRAPYSAPEPRCRQRRLTSGSSGSNGHSNGHGSGHNNGHNNGHGISHDHGSGSLTKEKSGLSTVTSTTTAAAAVGGHGGGSAARRVVSLMGGALAAAMDGGDGAVSHHGSFGAAAGGGASTVSVTWNPHLISPRPRAQSGGVSNLSYKPPSNVTAEPAAAVLQRRRAAFAAARSSVGSSGGGSCGGAFLFGSGSAVAAGLLRSSLSCSPTGQNSQGPLVQLLTIGLGTTIDVDGAAKGADGGDGDGDGADSGQLGFGGAFGEDGCVGSDSYGYIWPMAGWRVLGTTADGDAEAVRAAMEGSAMEPGSLPYYMLPTTSPVLGPLLRRSLGAIPDGAAAAAAAANALPSKPSIFAPPQQLYMKASEDLDDGPGGPVATVATAAAKAGRWSPAPSPLSPTPSSVADRASLRIPSLELALLRSSLNVPPVAGGGGDGGSRDGSGGGAAAACGGCGRPGPLVRCDSDLGQSYHGGGVDGEEGAGGGGAAVAPTATNSPQLASTGATRSPGEALRSPLRVAAIQSSPSTPMAGVTSYFKLQTNTGSPTGGATLDGGSGGGGGADIAGSAEAQLRARRRTSARGPLASLDGDPSAATSGPATMGDTTKMLQVGISVAALLEVVKALPTSQRFATTAEVFENWLMPPTRASQCRFLDMVMARVKIVLGELPDSSAPPPTPGSRVSYNGMPVLHPDRTWFGPPDHYVIHSWSGNFMSLVAALREYCGAINKTPSSTYVWLDVVAANHHLGRKDKRELPHCKQIMATARKALLVLDPMAISLTRLWCLYEIWLAVCALPGASPSKLTLLNAGADWDGFADSFFRIDLSRCATTAPEDRAKLLEDMIRTSHDAGSGSNSQHASGTTISPYGVVAALPQLSAAVRAALFDAAAGDMAEARRMARAGGIGVLALLDTVERYAMIRRLAGGHVEAEEQLEAAVAVAMGVSGGRNSSRPLSPPQLAKSPAASGAGNGAGGGSGVAATVSAEITVSGGILGGSGGGGGGGAASAKVDSTAAAPAPAPTSWTDSGADGNGAEPRPPPTPPLATLPPIFPSYHTSSAVAAAVIAAATGGSASSSHSNRPVGPTGGAVAEDDGLAAAAAASSANALTNAAAWRKKPATLAALAVLQAEHGRLIQASTHAAMAMSCIPGLALVRPAAPMQDKDADGDGGDPYDNGGGGSGHSTRHGCCSGIGGSSFYSHNHHNHHNHHSHNAGGGGGVGGITRQRSISPPGMHSFPSMRRHGAYDSSGGGGNSGSGGDHDRKGGAGHLRGGGGGGGCGGGGGGSGNGVAPSPSSPPLAPGEIAWKGSYWELTSPQTVTAEAARAIFMASIVEAACGRHEAAAQLALQAGLARAAALGPAHPSTITTKRAAVTHLIHLGRLTEAGLLAKSLLRQAVSEHGEVHQAVGICHCAVAMVLAAQNKAELAYSSGQRGAEVLAASLGRTHPATLEALQLCADMLESAREYSKAVALMRLVVQGRSVPGAIRASPASPAFLAPNNRLLHLRTIAALEEKAMSEEHSRRAMIGVMRNLARLETELRAALTAMTGAAPQTKMQIQRDLELVLMAQNKRYEAAMLRKGELG